MGLISDPPGHPGYGADALRVTNPSYAEYLKTPAGKIIAEQAQQIAALTARCEALESTLAEALDALERSYDYTEWPADGTSFQEKTAVKVRAVLDRQQSADGGGA